MQCREFREISDSYLNDELLVETNHQVYSHLENCPDCRADFAARRELRAKVKKAVRNAEELRIDPIFLSTLQAGLREAALVKVWWKKPLFNPKFAIPVMATLLIALVMGIVYLKDSTNIDGLITQYKLSKGLAEIALKAVGDHRDCALEKLGIWEAMSHTDYAEKAVYTEKVLKPLQASFSKNVEMLSVHDCIYQGKQFRHVVLRDGANIVSVFFAETDVLTAPSDSPDNTIVSEIENGLQVASFYNKTQAILVVSDLPETANFNIARTLRDRLNQSSEI